ncbi:Na+/H+ antiporter NhaA [bacterium]|nr:Na+/H+ antiporter NhaA [bacterium]
MGHRSSLDRVFRHDARGGILLMLSAIAALLEANSSLSGVYENVLSSDFAVTLNGVGLQKPPIVWMNDGLMAISDLLAPQQRP